MILLFPTMLSCFAIVAGVLLLELLAQKLLIPVEGLKHDWARSFQNELGDSSGADCSTKERFTWLQQDHKYT